MKLKYRAEIDGLRALSIIPVIFFHCNISFFSGGYLGVDIFFVISGFLITSIIIDDIQENKFSLIYFYERRCRRILPALFFTLIITYFISFYYLNPINLVNYSKSAISSLAFFSNFYFWKQLGYFAVKADYLSLLHTWSLSIEEQFYLFFPLLLICLTKAKVRLIFLLVIIFCISLFLSNFASNFDLSYPFVKKFDQWDFFNATTQTSFFFSITRVWELILGSVVALMYKNKIFYIEKKITLISFIILILGFIFFTKNTPHPGIITFLYLMNVCILILDSSENSYVNKILKTNIMNSIGKMSYSLYLIHVPILVYMRLSHENLITAFDKFLFITIIFLVSYFSYKYIEIPFRKKNYISKKYFFYIIAFFFLIIGTINIITINKDGFDNRFLYVKKIFPNYSLNNNKNYKERTEYLKLKNKLFQNNKKKKILIVGNSHAEDWFFILDQYTKKINKNLEINYYRDYEFSKITKTNSEFLTKLENSKLFKKADLILISNSFLNEAHFIGLDILTNFILNYSKKIIIMNNSPEFNSPVSDPVFRCITKINRNNLNFNSCGKYLFNIINPDVFQRNLKLEKFSKSKNIILLDKFSLFCDKNSKFCSPLLPDGKKIFWDSNHITINAAKSLTTKISNLSFLEKLDE